MIRRPPRSTRVRSSAASDVYKRQKSLGAAAKGGTTPLNDVLLYAQQAEKKGFLFMDSPGYDPASVTGQIASGCNVVTFTTGRGSCFGCKPSPSIKIATNTEMYNNMIEDMDVNCLLYTSPSPRD